MFYNYHLAIADRISTILSRSRTHAGLSRRKISEMVGVSESTVKAWEAGQGSPTLPGAMAWFRATGESPFRPLLDFLWPEAFRDLTGSSSDEEIRTALTVYFSEVAGVMEIRKLHYLVFGNHGSKWSGLLDMACAYSHSSLNSRYRVAELIQTSYDLCLANGDLIAPCYDADRPLLLKSIAAAKKAYEAHMPGYTVGALKCTSVDHLASAIMSKARQDAGVSRRNIAKAMGKTERTITNWELFAEPSFRDICIWFHIINKPLWPYLRNAFNPSEPIEFCAEDRMLCDALIEHFSKTDILEAKKLSYLMIGRYGSNWLSVLEMLYEYVHTPLHQRILSARSVLVGYRFDQNDALLRETEDIPPDVDNLERCIALGTYAAKSGLQSYVDLEETVLIPT